MVNEQLALEPETSEIALNVRRGPDYAPTDTVLGKR